MPRFFPHKSISQEMAEYLLGSDHELIENYSAHVVTQGNDATVANHFATLVSQLAQHAILRYYMTDDAPDQILMCFSASAQAAANYFALKQHCGAVLTYAWRGQSATVNVPDHVSSGHSEASLLNEGLNSALISDDRDALFALQMVPYTALENAGGQIFLNALLLQSLVRDDSNANPDLVDAMRQCKPSRNLDAKYLHAKGVALLALHDEDESAFGDAVTQALAKHARLYDNDSRNLRVSVHGLMSVDMMALLKLAGLRQPRWDISIDSPYVPVSLLGN